MHKRVKRLIALWIIIFSIVSLAILLFAMFYDEAEIVRKGTIFRAPTNEKIVALTFDDGPSPVWTPKILEALKKAGVKATFFILGEHAQRYPEIIKRIAGDGHEIENHTYDHHVLIYYKMEELEREIKDTEKIIKDITGRTTVYFRPPKAWLTNEEKQKIKAMGYGIILWSLNSKDWVTFDDKYIIRYILRNIRPGDIILFHDSGGVFTSEGGDRRETVATIPRLVEKLKEKGYRFATVAELLKQGKQ